MDFNRFTEKMQDAVRTAQSLAVQHGNQQLDVEHLMLALLEQQGGLAPAILNKADIRVDALRSRIQQEVDRLPKVSGTAVSPDQIYVTPRITKLITQAEEEAKRLKDEYTSIEHVLLAAEAAGVSRVIHFSSAQVFGTAEAERAPDYFPVDDGHPRRAMRPYGLSKCLAEDLCAGFTARTRIATISLRPVSVWDPGMYRRIEAEWRSDPRSEWEP